jgi:hypothetical protein
LLGIKKLSTASGHRRRSVIAPCTVETQDDVTLTGNRLADVGFWDPFIFSVDNRMFEEYCPVGLTPQTVRVIQKGNPRLPLPHLEVNDWHGDHEMEGGTAFLHRFHHCIFANTRRTGNDDKQWSGMDDVER